jgi:hypothetical protein
MDCSQSPKKKAHRPVQFGTTITKLPGKNPNRMNARICWTMHFATLLRQETATFTWSGNTGRASQGSLD